MFLLLKVNLNPFYHFYLNNWSDQAQNKIGSSYGKLHALYGLNQQ